MIQIIQIRVRLIHKPIIISQSYIKLLVQNLCRHTYEEDQKEKSTLRCIDRIASGCNMKITTLNMIFSI